jgi:anthranilate synthase component 1
MVSPTREEFTEKARLGNLIPVYREILADLETPVSAFLKLTGDRPEDAGITHASRGYPRRGDAETAAQGPRPNAQRLTPHAFLLESVEGGERIGRYSFIGGDPFVVV